MGRSGVVETSAVGAVMRTAKPESAKQRAAATLERTFELGGWS